MRKLLATALALLLAITPAYAQKTKAQLSTEIGTNLPDNTTGLITPAILRTTLTDMVNSWYGLIDATNSGTGQVTAGGFALSTVPAASILTMSGTYVNLLSTDANEQIFLGTQAIDPSIIFRATQYLWETQAAVSVAALTTGTSATLTIGRGAGNQVGLFSAPSGQGVSVFATGTDTNIPLNLQSKGTSNVSILNNGGANQIGQFFQASANPVNFVAIGANQTGSAAQINAFGSDANITLSLFPKGTGSIFIGSGTNSAALAFGGVTSGVVTMQVQAAAGTYNFNLPTTAGTAGQVLTSQGGGSTAMTWSTVGAPTAPQVSVFTTGSAQTYTTPANTLYLVVEVLGGGGGGGGNGSAASGAGGNGVASTFVGTGTNISAGGGTGGAASNNQTQQGGAGGAASGGDINITGAGGMGNYGLGGGSTGGPRGAGSFYGDGGQGGNGVTVTGQAAVVLGAGGGGAGQNSNSQAAPSGAAGAYVRKLITSPAATYTYTVGTAGGAGAAGTGGAAGGAGAAGLIVVTARFQ